MIGSTLSQTELPNMYKKLFVLITGLLLSASVLAGQQVDLGVQGLACPYCAFGIEKRLLKVEGVEQVEVNVVDNTVQLSMQPDHTLTEDRARQAVEEAGFTLESFATTDTDDT